ncbi:MAG: hypothetical protein UV26_C0030G0012 [candidate division WWE3 bacterium GW2011_GWF2_42_42]|uniref:Uncharacterized protein n=1 Tax=candidate division WWE3 bacterium GW2011_GWF2_42_42 TaxID=1619142 RepID=A0A0G1ADA6_UNCKA|nr:MAG: hypothetical protein UV26_C0030G0012 [candidate division WWE3 bacterium GW2011_GWF2_42_42]
MIATVLAFVSIAFVWVMGLLVIWVTGKDSFRAKVSPIWFMFNQNKG